MNNTWERIKSYLTLTNLIYLILLSFSCYMLINYLTDMVDGTDVKLGIGLFAICLDMGAQYVFITALIEWSRGRWKKGLYKHRIAAIVLLLIFGLYESCFAVPSSISFFLVQVDIKEQVNRTIADQTNDNRDKLKDIKDELAALNIGLAAEAKTTIRQNGQAIIDRKKELQAQWDAIENDNKETARIQDKIFTGAINSFKVTADNFGINEKFAKVLTFGIAIFLLRILMILFCIKIKGERLAAITATKNTESETCETKFEKDETETEPKIQFRMIETQTETEPKTKLRKIETQTVKNGKKICPVCGKYFPFKHEDKIFCGSKCRSAAHRNKSLVKETKAI